MAHGQVDGTDTWRPDSAGKEFYISTLLEETAHSWHVARGLCMQNGGDLASIHSEEEKNFITQYVSLFVFNIVTARVCGKVIFSYCLSVWVCVCLSVWAITFECLDIET